MLISLLIGTMIPFFASYNTNITETQKELAELFGGKIFICTDDGFKWVDISELENEDNKHSEKYECPLCYIQANNPHSNITKETAFLKPSFYYTQVTHKYKNLLFVSETTTSNVFSRAPPLSFVS